MARYEGKKDPIVQSTGSELVTIYNWLFLINSWYFDCMFIVCVVCLSVTVCLSVAVCLFMCLPISLSVRSSFCLSVCLSVCLFVCLYRAVVSTPSCIYLPLRPLP